jgi:hypothetical protein
LDACLESIHSARTKYGEFEINKFLGKVVAKGQWSGSSNTANKGGKTRVQLLKEGKEVASLREKVEEPKTIPARRGFVCCPLSAGCCLLSAGCWLLLAAVCRLLLLTICYLLCDICFLITSGCYLP